MSWFSEEFEAAPSRGAGGCQKCGGFESERGVCVGCGVVMTEFEVSEEITFTADRVPLGHSYDAVVQPRGDRELGTSYDRYAVGRAAVRKITSALGGVTDDVVSKADATYRLAVVYNFVKAGRPVTHVAAACVYVACRKSRFPLLLMDVSQILKINLFKLGRLVKKLCEALHQKLNTCPLLAAYGTSEYVDASLYVARFVRKLEFGDDAQRITNLACRVLQKMQNDWIQCGRHPAGLFGASIVIAARLLGFNRTHKEVARYVFIAGVTIGKRVYEFAQSTAGEMTFADFENQDHDFGVSANPPAFTRALEKLKEDEAPTPDVKEWLDIGAKEATFSTTEHEQDEPLSDSELDGYILNDTQHSVEIEVRNNMYQMQYGAWEVEKAKKIAEKIRIQDEKKANRRKRKHPKTIRAAKKRKAQELSELALNDPKTAPLFQELGKSVSVAPAAILDTSDDIKEEIPPVNDTRMKNEPTNTENTPHLANTQDKYEEDSDKSMSDFDDYDFDFDAQARDRASDDDDFGDPFEDDLAWG